ncbi:MAG TPA: ATP-binding protein [Deltaproteobacteria bacterium]|nr:ATP-binding protein [Deltaproteobacteria bacterium]
MNILSYPFFKTAGKIINSDQTRTLLFTGNIHDLFANVINNETTYVPLVDYLTANWQVSERMILVYELNGPIRFMSPKNRDKIRDAWLKWRTGYDADSLAIEKMFAREKVRAQIEVMNKSFDDNLMSAVGNPTVALELLRQMCLCSRSVINDSPVLSEDLIIIIESGDMLIPEGDISHLSDADRHRISICRDWFSDPGFMNSNDTVVLVVESKSMINQRIASLPQMISVNIQAPDEAQREYFIRWFDDRRPEGEKLKLWSNIDDLAKYSAGLSIHALMQMLKSAAYEQRPLKPSDVVEKVEEYIKSQLGEDIVEFKKPSHRIDNLVGFSNLKAFFKKELIPRLKTTKAGALPGAAVCGPIGGGKTFIFEAVASELDMIVIVLKNLRSQWFGQTDVILERLRRVIDALAKVLIFVDEADTQFGGVGPEVHATERRLTGKIQAMMSDSRLHGRVFWLLMTARIHLLSPDIRRPGRVGDLIIPVLDPEGRDRNDFIQWTVSDVLNEPLTPETETLFGKTMKNYSAAGFASLKSELKAKSAIMNKKLTVEDVREIIEDHIAPAIGETRRYQTLQALINCTRRSLLPNPETTDEDRSAWEYEIRELERKGIR